MLSLTVLHAVHRLVRLIPNCLPGKLQIARCSLRPFHSLASIQIPDKFGNRMWCPSVEETITQSLFAYGVYEHSTIASILARLPAGGVYVDVGSNIGTMALPVAASRPDAQIICVEAAPKIAAVLRRNVSDNARSNITVIEALVGSETGVSTDFYPAPDRKFGMGSIGPQFSGKPISLKQKALDLILDEQGIQQVDVVKIDVEGAELGVLRSLVRRLTGPKPPVVIFEFCDWAEVRIPGQSAGGAQAFLISNGYRLFPLYPDASLGAEFVAPITIGGAMILASRPSEM